MNDSGDWNEWRRHILAELRRLDRSIETQNKLVWGALLGVLGIVGKVVIDVLFQFSK